MYHGVGDALLCAFVFAKAYKVAKNSAAASRLVYGTAAAQVAYDAVDTAYNGYMAYEAFKTDPASGGVQAGVTLLRLMGVVLSAKELKLLEKLDELSDYRIQMYDANPGSVYASTLGVGKLGDLRLRLGPTRFRNKITVVDADDANLKVHAGWHTSYKPGTKLVYYETGVEEQFVRVHTKDNGPGEWIMKKNAITGLTAQQIQSKYQIPTLPTHISIVTLPPGTLIRSGTVHQGINRIKKFEHIPTWDRRSKQYEIRSSLDETWFSEEVPISNVKWISQ